jgi:hypothetical protein
MRVRRLAAAFALKFQRNTLRKADGFFQQQCGAKQLGVAVRSAYELKPNGSSVLGQAAGD